MNIWKPLLVAMLSVPAYAQTEAPPAAPDTATPAATTPAAEHAHGSHRDRSKKKGPCVVVQQACAAAGFSRGGHKDGGKGLHNDCMKPLLEGQTVAGVTVDAAALAACKDRKAGKHTPKP